MGQVSKADVFVCMNVDCKSRGAESVLEALKERVKHGGVEVSIKSYLCFSACNLGPNIVIPDKRCWFSGVKPSDIEAIIDYLNGGPDLPHLKVQNDPDLEDVIYDFIDPALITDEE